MIRHANRWMPLLFAASLFNSCTCHKQVEEVAQAPTAAERPAGFHSSRPTVLAATPAAPAPEAKAKLAPTPTPGTGAVAVPNDFPSDVSLMKDAEVAQVNQMAGNARQVLVRTEQEQKQLYSFYEQDLRSKGWVLEQNYQAKEQGFLGFRKGNMVLNMTIANDPKNPGKRVVGIMYQEDKPPEFGDF